ncbi:MAG: FHA domain-containing protein, partial [Coriobacteriales bacterium]|nr:FHA domain-containing protein [Coriobacteriales bacterium]
GIGAHGRGSAGGRADSASFAGSQARLTDINAGKSYALIDAPVLGRDESCEITINDANISRRHAQLKKDATGRWKLTDLGSTNGTRLNGNPVTTALLRDGDQITLGITVLEFREN